MASTLGRGVAIPDADEKSDPRRTAGRPGAFEASDPFDASGAPSVSSASERELDRFERLEGLVRTLIDRFQASRAGESELREDLSERDTRIRSLEEQVLQLNQSRRDVAKRIDELIGVLDRLEAQIGARTAASHRDE